jgi:EmrB/QacA subfamily drug resistance transporter
MTSSRATSSAASANTTAAQLGPNYKWLVFAITAIGVFMSTLDSSIVNISLPAISSYFHAPLSGAVEWVVIVYLVVIAALLLSVGRLTDMTGRKHAWAAGIAIFTIGSALSGAAPSLGFLIGARALQSVGGALLFALGPAMLTSAFPPGERGQVLGLNALVVALGISAGPTIGGLITQSLTWRWIFYVNLPLGIIGFLATLRWFHDTTPRVTGKFDPWGALALTVGLAALTLGFSFGQEWGWASLKLIVSLLIGVAALAALILIERAVPSPIIPLSMLRNRVFTSANISLILSFLALFAVGFMMPFYLEQLRGFDVLEAGLLMTPFPLTIAIVAPFSGRLADRFGTRWLAAIGLFIACVGLILLSRINAQTSIPDLTWRLAFTGLGQALFQSPNNSALMGSAPRDRQGVASGFLATGRVVGQSLSVALAGAVFASLGGSEAGVELVALRAATATHATAAQVVAIAEQEKIFTNALSAAFVVCAMIALVGVATSLVRGDQG